VEQMTPKKRSSDDLAVRARTFVRKALTAHDKRRPSAERVRTTAAQIEKALAPLLGRTATEGSSKTKAKTQRT